MPSDGQEPEDNLIYEHSMFYYSNFSMYGGEMNGKQKMINPTIEANINYSNEVSPSSVDMSGSGVRDIVGVFNRQLADGLHPGAQLVVLRYGQVVLDRSAGGKLSTEPVSRIYGMGQKSSIRTFGALV
jgi:hypothetical protein